MALKTDEPVHESQKVQNVRKRNCNENAMKSFKQRLREIDWAELKNAKIPMKHINFCFKDLFYFMIIFYLK